MNRAQRRNAAKSGKKKFRPVNPGVPNNRLGVVPEEHTPDFSSVPLATICQSINLLIDELRGRGIPVYDFDNKDKAVQGIQILQGKVFFLAAKEEDGHEEV